MTITTERLLLRQWRPSDREPWAAMSADPVVMRHFPSRLTREQSDAMVGSKAADIEERGWGLWAVEVRQSGDFAGFIGMQPVKPDVPCAPAVEIGWRLAARFHGVGYATEGAREVVAYAFGPLGLPGLVAFTTVQNTASRRVMEKLGMTHDPAEDFDYPLDPPDWPERRHVLYRLEA